MVSAFQLILISLAHAAKYGLVRLIRASTTAVSFGTAQVANTGLNQTATTLKAIIPPTIYEF